MISNGVKIRDAIIPDIQVKLLALCLSDDENGILTSTQRKANSLDFQADIALRDLINQRINNNSKALPLVMRKRQLYEKRIKESKEENDIIKRLEDFTTVPLMLRKHLLYKESRAG